MGTTFSWPDLASTKFCWRANERLHPFPKGDNNEKWHTVAISQKFLPRTPDKFHSKLT